MNQRISRSIVDLKPHYAVVVIGSGYGGSIAASRMARAGKSVCLFEKGKEIRPGDYPSKELKAVKEMHVNGANTHIGKENGLYQFSVNEDINVFHGCGLGGTSLVNANVSLPPQEWVMEDERWPEEIRKDKSSLYAGIARAKAILQPVTYPVNEPGYPELYKVKAHEKSSAATGGKFKYTPINVQFRSGLNAVGYQQHKCNNCGDCITGCNVGAKNTTLMNYLPDAVSYGAEIYTEVNVSHLTQNEEGQWLIHFSIMETGAEKFSAEERFITADFVFLGAGTLGSTKILLQSRARGLDMSGEIGKHFTGNGDVLGFAYNSDQQVSGVGLGHLTPNRNRVPPGPCIVSVIDTREEEPLTDGMVIEEGVMPGVLSAIIPSSFIPLSRILGKDTDSGFIDFVKEKFREIASFFGGAYRGAIRNTQTFLVMAHDDNQGEMSLENGRLKISWEGVGQQEIFKKINARLKLAAKALGANSIPNPSWNKLMNYDLVTVHPLGGCIMGDDATKGVVNHKGQVYNAASGKEVYSNLVVCDGAIVPRSLGVNPLLTISGLAERNCALIAAENNWTIDYGHKPMNLPADSQKPGIQFTESMTGYILETKDAAISYEQARTTGEQQDNDFTFILTIQSNDVETFLKDPDHEAAMFGTVNCRALSSETISVNKGSFNLFVKDKSQVNTLMMKYRMEMHSVEGDVYHFQGFKEIKNDPGMDAWADLTTLFVDIHKVTDSQKELVAKGMLKIRVADFKKQVQTIKVIHAASAGERLKWLVQFSRFFTNNVVDAYSGIFHKINLFNPDEPPHTIRKLVAPEPVSYRFQAKDGVELELTRYKGGDKGPVMLIHGLGVSSLIFSIDTIEVNLVEYLTKHGYDVWLIDNRLSIKLPSSENRSSGDDVAKNDYEPAIELIKNETGKAKVHVAAHCFGSTTFLIALLGGLKDVGSLLISQIGPHVKPAGGNALKAKLHVSELLDVIGVDSLTAYTDVNSSWKSKIFNSLLKLYPYDKEDRTVDPVSNRITFLYGQLYELDQLNQETFGALHECFGVSNIDAFKHLSEMIRSGKVVSSQGEDIYMPHMKEAMALPITFIHGEENACFLPESTELTYDQLKQLNPGISYERHVIPKYGHIDCIFGKNAHKDVYPYILNHLEKHTN